MWPFKNKKRSHDPSKRHAKTGRKPSKRYYQAALKDNLTAGWGTAILSADTPLNSDLERLRARSRLLSGNEPYFKYWLKLQNRNVVGARGIHLQMKVVAKYNDDGSVDFDDRANRIIEDGWQRWCKRQNCTVNKRHDFVMVQKLVLKSMLRDGEIFVRKVKAWKGNSFRFALQLIEADHLDMRYTSVLASGNVVRMGVEFNEWNQAVAYHFHEKHPGDYIAHHPDRTKRIRLTADEVLHIYDPERVDQSRGLPDGTASMIRSNMLNGYQEAELVAARAASGKMGFFTSPDGESFEGDDSEFDEEGNETEVITEADPGTFDELPEGYDFKPYDPQHPTTAFGGFVKSILQGVASGLGINYNTMANDYEGVNFSSLRQANLNDREGWKEMQWWLIEQLHEQIFADWLLMALATGELNPLPTAKFEKFNRPSWRPRGWTWIDPQKEATANQTNIAMGVESLTAIAAEQGRDIEEIFQERQSEITAAAKYGIMLDSSDKPTTQVNDIDDE